MIVIGSPTAVACGDAYSAAATIDDPAITSVYYAVSGHDALIQLSQGPLGQQYWSAEFPVQSGQGGSFTSARGIRFRNAVAGSVADVVAVGLTSADPQASNLALSPSVTVNPGNLNFEHNGVLIAAEPGLNMQDADAAAVAGVDLTYTVVDQAGIAVAYKPVLTPVGIPVLIADTLLAAPAATVTFSAIPQTYRTLMVDFVGHSTDAATTTRLMHVVVNSDTGANYQFTYSEFNSAGGTFVGQHGQPFMVLADIVASGVGTSSGLATAGRITMPYYAETTFFPTFQCDYGYTPSGSADTQPHRGVAHGVWIGGTGVTRLDFTLVAGNWAAGSHFSLYGM